MPKSRTNVLIDNKIYVPLSMDVFNGNEKIDYNMYYKVKDNYVLLFSSKSIKLTPDILKKIKKIGSLRNIYVPIEKAEELLSKSHVFTPEIVEGYEELKDSVKDLLFSLEQGGTISTEAVESISENVEEKLKTIAVTTIIENINLVREVDEYLYTHSVNVAMLNGLMGRWLGLPENSIKTLVKIGLLHDIGKTRIDQKILHKPGKLTDEEFMEIKKHTLHSYTILKEMGIRDIEVLNGVVQHHEKINGFGYLHGLTAEEITPFAKITSVSDIYDAMVSKRCYKEPHSPFEILDWFHSGKFSDLDMGYVNKFISCMINELTDKDVVLSNGSIAKVIYVHKDKPLYPIINFEGKIIQTSSNLFPMTMHVSLENTNEAQTIARPEYNSNNPWAIPINQTQVSLQLLTPDNDTTPKRNDEER